MTAKMQIKHTHTHNYIHDLHYIHDNTCVSATKSNLHLVVKTVCAKLQRQESNRHTYSNAIGHSPSRRRSRCTHSQQNATCQDSATGAQCHGFQGCHQNTQKRIGWTSPSQSWRIKSWLVVDACCTCIWAVVFQANMVYIVRVLDHTVARLSRCIANHTNPQTFV